MDKLDKIIQDVAMEAEVSIQALTGTSRYKFLIKPRAEAMLRLREEGATLKEIGVLFSHRDHSTVIHSLKLAKREREYLASRKDAAQSTNQRSLRQ